MEPYLGGVREGSYSPPLFHSGIKLINPNGLKKLLKPATSTAAGMRYLPNAWVVIPH
jgi:hypothetical protein